MLATVAVSELDAACASAAQGATMASRIISVFGNESPGENRLPGIVLERAAVRDVFGEGISGGHGAARAPAAHGGASLCRFGSRPGLLLAPSRRRDVAAEGAF